MIPLQFGVLFFNLLESQPVVNLSADSEASEVKEWLNSRGFSERFVDPREKERTISMYCVVPRRLHRSSHLRSLASRVGETAKGHVCLCSDMQEMAKVEDLGKFWDQILHTSLSAKFRQICHFFHCLHLWTYPFKR